MGSMRPCCDVPLILTVLNRDSSTRYDHPYLRTVSTRYYHPDLRTVSIRGNIPKAFTLNVSICRPSYQE